jgi:hypothetical protein
MPKSETSSWNYAVLTHWPDGLWSDDSEDEVPEDEMPYYWQAISRPEVTL